MDTSEKADKAREAVRNHYARMKAAGNVKLNFWLTPKSAESLNYLMANSTADAKGDVINEAIILFAEAARKSAKGKGV